MIYKAMVIINNHKIREADFPATQEKFYANTCI